MTIDFLTRTALDGRKPVIRNGIAVNGHIIRTEPVTITEIERLYARYKTSVPDGRREKHQYFRAKTYEELTPAELLNGTNRARAKADLELTLLEGILNGSIKWTNPRAWFWQSKNDPDLVILREWVTGERRRTACHSRPLTESRP